MNQDNTGIQFTGFYVLSTILISILLKELSKKITIQARILILATGFILAYFNQHLGILGESIVYTFENSSVYLIGLIFIPTLIFMGNFGCDFYQFQKEFKNGMILSFPSLLIQMFLLAFTFIYLLGYDQFTFISALHVTSMLCPNSPGILAQKLTNLGVSSKFLTIFQIEKQFGLGIGLFLCKTLKKIMDQNFYELSDFFTISLHLIINIISSHFLGIMFGLVFSYWMRQVPRDTLQLNIILYVCYSLLAYICLGYQTFFGGFSIGLSTQALGLFMSHYGKLHIKKESLDNMIKLQQFLLDNISNILFMMMGNVCAILLKNNNVISITDFWKLLLLYILSYPIRAISFIPFYQKMSKQGNGMSKKKLIILILANEKTFLWLIIYHLTTDISKQQITLFYGCFFFILSVVGNSIISSDIVINWFNLKEQQIYKQNNQAMLYKKIMENNTQKIRLFKKKQNFWLANWEEVDKMSSFLTLKQISMQIQVMDHQQLINQTRYNVLVKIKSGVSVRLNDQRASITTFRTIEHACNICLDSLDCPINVWEIIRLQFQSIHHLQLLFKIRNIPIIGYFIKYQINKYISSVYEVCICAAASIRDTCLNIQQSPQFQYQTLQQGIDPSVYKEVKIIVVQELYQEKRKIDEYIQELYYTFNTILKTVQTRLSTQILLEFCFSEIKSLFKQRVLTEIEFNKCMKYFQYHADNLNITKFQIDLPNIEYLGVAYPVIQQLDQDELNILRKKSFVKDFKKGEYLFQQNKQTQYCFIVINGEVEEFTYNRLIQKSSLGHLVGKLNLFNNQICMTSAKVTKDTKCQVLLISQVLKVFKINKRFKKKLYRKSLFQLIQTHQKESLILKNLSQQDINLISKKGFLAKVEKGKTINIVHGAYVFKGQIIDKNLMQYHKYYYIPPVKFLEKLSKFRSNNNLVSLSKNSIYNFQRNNSQDEILNNEIYSDIFYAIEKSQIFIFNEFNYDILFKNDNKDRFSILVQQYQTQKKDETNSANIIDIDYEQQNENQMIQAGFQFHSSRSSYVSYEKSQLSKNIDQEIENYVLNEKNNDDQYLDKYLDITNQNYNQYKHM